MNLHSSDELREMADRCRGMANHSAAIYPTVWLQLSDKWDAMAEEAETLSKARSPTDPDLDLRFHRRLRPAGGAAVPHDEQADASADGFERNAWPVTRRTCRPRI